MVAGWPCRFWCLASREGVVWVSPDVAPGERIASSVCLELELVPSRHSASMAGGLYRLSLRLSASSDSEPTRACKRFLLERQRDAMEAEGARGDRCYVGATRSRGAVAGRRGPSLAGRAELQLARCTDLWQQPRRQCGLRHGGIGVAAGAPGRAMCASASDMVGGTCTAVAMVANMWRARAQSEPLALMPRRMLPQPRRALRR